MKKFNFRHLWHKREGFIFVLFEIDVDKEGFSIVFLNFILYYGNL